MNRTEIIQRTVFNITAWELKEKSELRKKQRIEKLKSKNMYVGLAAPMVNRNEYALR